MCVIYIEGRGMCQCVSSVTSCLMLRGHFVKAIFCSSVVATLVRLLRVGWT